ncbi:MAG: YkgJ family cysteine cluster protein [Marinifilaceae bacterium]|jgi:Fe-S-cluster containining protein|nr:YkgJ family cysteine cluster protein [Marinifilaceae bacterium]
MKIDLKQLADKAKKNRSENKKFYTKLKKQKPKNLDQLALQIHDEVFEEVDCLDCANCCKSISPIITDKDINRISKYLKIKATDFIDMYLEMDEEEDYVYRSAPCPFLQDDNYCSIYEQRPKACREYPHTDRAKLYKISDLCFKNIKYCPAVDLFTDKLKSKIVLR